MWLVLKLKLCFVSEFTFTNLDRLPQVSFADSMLATQMISGLINKEHQSRILSDAVTLSLIKSTFDRPLTSETPHLGNRSNAYPSASTMSDALKSQYRRKKFKKSTHNASEEKEKQH